MHEESSGWFLSQCDNFIKQRKYPDTALDAQTLITVFAQARQTSDGWIRAKDLRKILKEKNFKSGRTLSRFLKDLERIGLIFREERIELTPRSRPDKSKPNVYYQLSNKYVPNSLLASKRKLDRASRRFTELQIAKILLKELGISNPTAAINKRLEEEYSINISDENKEE